MKKQGLAHQPLQVFHQGWKYLCHSTSGCYFLFSQITFWESFEKKFAVFGEINCGSLNSEPFRDTIQWVVRGIRKLFSYLSGGSWVFKVKSCLFATWSLTSISLQLHWGTVSCFQGCSSSQIYSSHIPLCFMMFLLCHLQLMSGLIPRLMNYFKCLPCRQHPTCIYLFWISSLEQVVIQ